MRRYQRPCSSTSSAPSSTGAPASPARASASCRRSAMRLDWLAFADAWRGEYQPAMKEVRSGRVPFSKLDVLHRRNLERILPRFGIADLSEETLRALNLAWHVLPAWPEVPGAMARL